MKCTGMTTRYWLAILAICALIWVIPVGAQSQGAVPQDQDNDSHMSRQQIVGLDQFLDNHPEIAAQLQKNPSLVNNKDFIQDHPDLQHFLQQHPEVREDLSQNPGAVMHQEQRFDRRGDQGDRDVTRGELSNMDRFMDSHPEIAEELRKDPSRINNKDFIKDHPELKEFLAQHPELREEFRENPQAFMHQEQRFDRNEDMRDRDVTRGELSNMDRFMDSHPEIAEQLRKDPSRINNKDFIKDHPELKEFLAQHPELREEFKENPNAFMRQEQRFDRREDSNLGRDRDVNGAELASFHEFLQSHSAISKELSKDPSLVKNQEYLDKHPELQTYLQNHPEVREEANEHPQSFLKSAQNFDPKAKNKAMTADSRGMGAHPHGHK